jgi:DNA-binding transcriptional regulator YiaG
VVVYLDQHGNELPLAEPKMGNRAGRNRLSFKPGEHHGPAAMRLRELRLKAGLSMLQLASRVGIPYNRLEVYERGHRLPTEVDLNAILRVLAEELRVPKI